MGESGKYARMFILVNIAMSNHHILYAYIMIKSFAHRDSLYVLMSNMNVHFIRDH